MNGLLFRAGPARSWPVVDRESGQATGGCSPLKVSAGEVRGLFAHPSAILIFQNIQNIRNIDVLPPTTLIR